jgi:ribosome-binding ATPase YchF (GTP1/OBG family)
LCHLQALRKRAAEEGCEVVVVSAKVESELSDMPPEEASEWLDMLGVTSGDGGLSSLIRANYKTLGLQTYFTTGGCIIVGVGGGKRTMSMSLQ